MTDSNWTSDQIAQEFTDCETVGEVLHRLETMVASRGEVICEIRLNGQVIDETDEARLAKDPEKENPRSAIRSLSIRSDRPESLIGQALRSSLSFIPLLTQASVDTAGRFRDGDVHNGSEQLNEALEGCQWFVETIHHARGAASGIGFGVHQIERWQQAEKMLFDVITELTATFDRKDYVMVADLLEYELTTALEMWVPVLGYEAERRPV
jgi:hypothetical protein